MTSSLTGGGRMQEEALIHYGVLGMKWGVRKDRDRTSGNSKIDKVNSEEEQTKKRGLTAKQKKALKIGAVVVGSAIAAYGAYRFYKATEIRTSPNFDKASGVMKKSDKHSDLESVDVLRVNKGRYFTGDPGAQNNCMRCSVAYDLRRKGYNVRAGKTPFGHDPSDIDAWYPGVKHDKVAPTARRKGDMADAWNTILKDSDGSVLYARDMRRKDPQAYKRAKELQAGAMIKQMESHGPNARGTAFVYWETGGGHAVAWQTDSKGKAHLVEAQIGEAGKRITNDELSRLNPFREMEVLRLDNVTPDVKKMVDNGIVRNERDWHGTNADKAAIAIGGVGALGAAKAYRTNVEEDDQNASRRS